MFNLFDDTKFHTMALVEKGRYDRSAQVRQSWWSGIELS